MYDQNLELMAAQTLTETGDSEKVIDLGAGYAPQPYRPLGLELNVTARDYTTENETYVVDVQESADGQSYVSTGLKLTITATGHLRKVVTSTKRYLKLVWTLGGTTPSITADAWLLPL